MYDIDLVLEILLQIDGAIIKINRRFEPIKSVDDFLDTEEGQEKIDSICMLLIAIGESLKNIDKITDKKLLLKYKTIDWKKVKGVRDVISHHYFDLNAEVIFSICNRHIFDLEKTIKNIISDLKN